jgi:hypothetical protein
MIQQPLSNPALSIERIVQLYDSWGKKDKTDEWRKKLAEAKKKNNKPTNCI